MRNVHVALLLVLAAALGCQTRPLPLSAQAGSTIAIPLAWGIAPIGYGGTYYTDYQRGTMVFRLGGPTGMELTTRYTSIAAPSPKAPMATTSDSFGGQVVSLVDLPASAPLGTRDLYVARRIGITETPFTYAGQMKVLPNSVTAGTENVLGQPTPAEYFPFWLGPSSSFIGMAGSDIAKSIPRPAVVVGLSPAAWTAAFTFTYPSSVITVVDAVPPVGQRATVWRKTITGNQVRIDAAANGAPLQSVAVVFDLVNGASQTLSTGQVTVQMVAATDLHGVPITVAPSVAIQ